MEERTAPLRIGYELTGAALDAAGGRRSALGLLGALRARDDVEVVELAQPRAGAGALRGLARELRWMPRGLPRAATGLDLLHCPLPLLPPSSPVPLVATVHDTLALDRPDWFTRANAWYTRRVLPGRLRRAARVVCPSDHTREAVVRGFGIDESVVHVAPWGVDARFRPGDRDEALLRRLGVPGAYVLAVGTLQPRKNLEAAVAAFEADPEKDHRLVIAGARGWHHRALLDRVDRSPARNRIVLAGELPDDELAALYRGADCLLFPSLGEGFGLPAVEAMASGTPVVVSDRGALPEVVGDAGVVVDPSDASAWAQVLDELLNDEERREALRARGLARAREFTWERCAELTVAAYREAVRR